MQTQRMGSPAQVGVQAASRLETLIAAAMAALLGAFLLWGVGFSHGEVLHNAAHDVRHSLAFPCH
jgi:cobalt transporter subunit CbtB